MEPGHPLDVPRDRRRGHRQKVVVTVTDQTKEIANGVTARVVRDTVTEDGALVEDTFDWYAQDADGNVWYLGEDTAEFEDGKVSSTAGLVRGRRRRRPARHRSSPPTRPPGMAYRQEYYAGEAEDNGAVLSARRAGRGARRPVHRRAADARPTPLDPGVLEYKLYAPGVGPVMALGISGGASREELLTVDTAPAGFGTGPLGRP